MILSEFAGAAHSLNGSIIFNPVRFSIMDHIMDFLTGRGSIVEHRRGSQGYPCRNDYGS